MIINLALNFTQDPIAYAYRDDSKKTIIIKMDGSETRSGLPLKEMLKYLNPTDYHVLTKNFIVHIDAISYLENLNETLIIKLRPAFEKPLLVPAEHVNSFRNWMYLHYK